jgi:diguanylate cyclase (GGDEF)-like protein
MFDAPMGTPTGKTDAMSSTPFFPKILMNSDEFYKERSSLLMIRGLAGLILAVLCSLAAIILIQLRGASSTWWLSVFILLGYTPAFITSILYLISKPQGFHKQKAFVRRFTWQVLLIVVMWNGVAMSILPSLDVETRLIAICLFIASVFSHFLPFTLFPRVALLVLVTNLIPLSLQLTFLGDEQVISLGLSAFVLVVMEVLLITWLYRTDMDAFRRESNQDKEILSEPDMSEESIRKARVSSLYFHSTQSLVLQTATAFFLVITMRNNATEALMWSWFLGFVSVQAFRSACFVSFMDDSSKRPQLQWRLIFGFGMLASLSAWFVYLVIFYEALNGVSLGLVGGLLIVVAGLSTIGLAADRALLYLNSLISLAPLIILVNSDLNIWLLSALIILGVLSLLVVVENIYQSSTRSLRGSLLQKLAEYRAARMEELNLDLTNARKRLTDVNQSLEAQILERTRELKHQADHDMLTGLGNRYRFAVVVKEALEGYESDHQSGFAVYMLDLNRFKEINDGLGHFAGDHVLRETARRIQEECGENRVCARWGGDEFVIFQPEVTSREDIHIFSEALINRIRLPIELDNGPVIIGASIGISVCPEHGTTADELLEHADIAVYRAKYMKDGISIYNDNWGKEAAERMRLAQALRLAIESHAIDVAFQPFVSISDGNIKGFEALARWPQAEGYPISPGVFIPLAEEYGLMPLLGSRVLRRACEMLQHYCPDSDHRVAVNISVLQLRDPDFASEVFGILDDIGLSPSRLEVEMTENVFADDVEQIRSVLNELRARGVTVSIDDFGTGYSSISYLRNFPLDTLKVDRSFVTALKDGGEGIYRSIVTLAYGLELSVIVEGVETDEELEAVLRLGGDEIQGYYFAKPMMESDLDQWLPRHLSSGFQLSPALLKTNT